MLGARIRLSSRHVLAGLSPLIEGPAAVGAAFVGMSLLTVGAIAYLAFFSTLLGYGIWNGFIMRYGAGRIAPFSLMVPVFGVASASLVRGERLRATDAAGALLILAGLLLHMLGGRIRLSRSRGPRGARRRRAAARP